MVLIRLNTTCLAEVCICSDLGSDLHSQVPAVFHSVGWIYLGVSKNTPSLERREFFLTFFEQSV